MIQAVLKSFGQLADPRINWVVLVSLAGALATFVGLWALLHWLIVTGGILEGGWFAVLADWVSGAAVLVLAFFLFPGVVTLFAGMLLEYVVRAVEARHYPRLPPPRDQPLVEVFVYLLRFTGLVVLLNLVVLPLYLLLPGLNFIIFWALNGYLLGREYFEMVALRRLDPDEGRATRRANAGRIFVAGLVIAVLMTVPVLNLLMPVVAAAFMTHVFHGLRRPVSGAS